MGIQGLLPLLKSIQVNTHLSEFKGQTYIEYVLHRVRMMRHYGVKPYLVFDGGPLPAKKGTESDRSKKRAENLARANKLTEQGQHAQAREILTRCVDVTPEMAAQVIKALKVEAIPYVVAPYEADAQLAYLERSGIVDGVITEDSDLLVFGCRNVLFKLDPDGNCVNIKREKLGCVKEAPMYGWTDKEFREMAILSGCDYLPSITGLGIKTSHKLMRKYKTVEKVLQYIRLESNMKVPAGYLDAFRVAQLPFLYQRVFDPRSGTVVHLNPLEDCIEWDETRDAYVGIHLDADIARGIADGSVNPITMEAMNDINPQYQPHSSSSKVPLAERNRPKPSAPNSNGQTLKKFFTVLPKSRQSFGVPSGSSSGRSSPRQRRKSTGTSSGHRTLLEQMDSEREQKRQRESQVRHASPPLGGPTTSRFFARTTSAKRKRDETESGTAASIPITPRRARRARPSPTQDEDLDKENEVPLSASFPDLVQQEEGYRSPTGSSDIVEVSSPIERLSIVGLKQDQVGAEEIQVQSEDVSSPVVVVTPALRARTTVHIPYNSPTKPDGLSQASAILVFSTPESCQASREPLSVDLADVVQSFPGCDEADQSFQSAGGPVTPGQEGDLWEDDKVDFEVDADDSHPEDPAFLRNLIGHPEPVDTGLQDIMAGWRNRWSHLGATGGKETKETSTTLISVADDVFGIREEALGSCLTDQKSFAPTSATKFKRRRPLGEQTGPGGNAARRSDDSIGLSRNNTKSRQVPHLDESSDESLSSGILSQRLRDFRYVPA
ncbi:Rad2 nuclease [Tulasnella sp. UAMH 9824]|nr:Rad2 nuclease [Tulasnella sp. UAMH 9824]